MDTLLTGLIGLGYVVGPLGIAAMVYIGWKLVRDQRHDRS